MAESNDRRIVKLTLLIASAFVVAMSLLAQQPSHKEIVVEVRAKYGDRVSPAQAPALLNAIAVKLTQVYGGKWGLLVKSSGNNCGGFACDIICDEADHWDVLIDSPDAEDGYSGTAGPDWRPIGPYAPRVCAYVNPGAPPVPDPGPLPPNEEIESLKAAVAQLRSEVNDLKSLEVETEALRRRDAELMAEIELLKNTPPTYPPLPPFPCSRGKVLGAIPVRVCPESQP